MTARPASSRLDVVDYVKRENPCPCGSDIYEIAEYVFLCVNEQYPHLFEGMWLSSPISQESALKIAKRLLYYEADGYLSGKEMKR